MTTSIPTRESIEMPRIRTPKGLPLPSRVIVPCSLQPNGTVLDGSRIYGAQNVTWLGFASPGLACLYPRRRDVRQGEQHRLGR